MIGPVSPGAPFDAFADAFAQGLVGQITVGIYDQLNNEVLAPTTVGIVEVAPIGALARYAVTLSAPVIPDTYLVVWDDNEPDPQSASEEVLVSASTSVSTGPGWITGDDVAECCADLDVGSDTTFLDDAAEAANDVLYRLSGRQFRGLAGPVKVRPYRTACSCWTLPWSTVPTWTGSTWGRPVRCKPLSVVTLSGYPVREIFGVKVDGAWLTADTWRLDNARDLVRMRDPATPRQRLYWPGCQTLDLHDTEPGTWSVTYTFGADPPWQGVAAAKELACEIARACVDSDACQIPSGVVRVVRSGVTVDRAVLASAIAAGVLGLPMVDLFLGTYNPDRLPRRSAVWSPDVDPYPYHAGG